MNENNESIFKQAEITPEEVAEAFKLANENIPMAQFNVGTIRANGLDGKKPNLREAFSWYEKASKQGFGIAAHMCARICYSGQVMFLRRKRAIDFWKLASEKEIAQAQFNLANCYLTADLVKQDTKKAFSLMEKSSENGFVMAMANLGNLYYQAVGVEKDEDKAIYWWSRASIGGDDYSTMMLDNLLGVEKAMKMIEKVKKDHAENIQKNVENSKDYHEGRFIPV